MGSTTVGRTMLLTLASAMMLPSGLMSQDTPGSPGVRNANPPLVPSVQLRDPRTSIAFDQVAQPSAIGQVVGSLAGFDPNRLPATFAANDCTATLIGPRVLLTAAHCVDSTTANGTHAVRKGTIRLAGETVRRPIAACAIAPAYLSASPTVNVPRSSHDFALCEMANTVPVRAETLTDLAKPLTTGTSLLVAGYGCSEKSVVQNNGRIPQFHNEYASRNRTLRVGLNTITSTVIRGWATLRGRVGSTAAIICPGDSGGAVYAGASPEPGRNSGWRIVAVNSAVGVTTEQHEADVAARPNPPGVGVEYFSYISLLSDPAFVNFLRDWHSKDPVRRRICGYDGTTHLNATCRA